jgi:hypothetical protein
LDEGAYVGWGGGKWCGRHGLQSPRGGKIRGKMSTLDEEFDFMRSTDFKLLNQMKGSPVYNCRSLKFIVSLRAVIVIIRPSAKIPNYGTVCKKISCVSYKMIEFA